MLSYKAVLLFLYTFIRGTGYGDDNSYKIHQALLVWSATIIFLLRFVVFNKGKLPYRIVSSNVIFLILCAVLIGNVSLGLANALGVNNVVTVNSRQTILLASLNFGGYFGILIMLFIVSVNPYALWPSVRTIFRIESNPNFLLLAKRWMATILYANNVKDNVMRNPVETADAFGLEKSIRDLRSCWLAARHHGSIFELLIGELIEELVIVRALRLPSLARRDPNWDSAYQDAIASGTFTKRNDHYRLMAPRKRRVLTKLLSLRMMQQREPEVESDLWEAMTDKNMQQALRQVVLLEGTTRKLVERGEEFEKMREKQMYAQIGYTNEREGMSSEQFSEVLKHSGFIPNSAETEHMRDTEDALYRWENIIDTIEEFQYEQPFTRRLFTMDRMENWYGYRKMLLTQLSEMKHFFEIHYENHDKDNNSTSGINDGYNDSEDQSTDDMAAADRERAQAFFDKNQAGAEGLM